VGSFVGAWGGGMIYDRLGSYDRAWQAAVLIGMIAGAFQMLMNVRPPLKRDTPSAVLAGAN
jgi:predicted MFS family arabinose efflux permease